MKNARDGLWALDETGWYVAPRCSYKSARTNALRDYEQYIVM